jgi:nitroreductase
MDLDTLREFTSRQRAIRIIDASKPVDDTLIGEILRIGTHAPSGGNRQPYRFIVIRDAAIRKQLAEIYDRIADARYGNPQSRTTWSDVPVLIAICSEGPSQDPTSHAASILPAVQNILLAIHAAGLGSVLTTLWREESAKVNQVLGLPDGAEVQVILPVGWPTRKYGRNHRRPISEVTYRDRYGESW